MRTTAALLLALAAPAASAQELARLFTDKGSTYLRSPSASTLVLGNELPAFSDASGTKGVGKVIVMEVVGQLVRVSFEDDATKAAAKYVRISGKGAVAPGAPPPPPPPPPLPPPPTATPPPPPPALKA